MFKQKQFLNIFHLTAIPPVLLLALLAFTPLTLAQEPVREPAVEVAADPGWLAPKITALSIDWWQQLDITKPVLFKERAAQFIALSREKVLGLDGNELVSGQNLLTTIKGQIDLLVVAMQDSGSESFEPVPTRDTYTLEELLSLRARWRNLEKRQMLPQLRIDELQRQTALLEQHRENLVQQYKVTDSNEPARILLGLQRVSARIEFDLSKRQLVQQQKRLADHQQQNQLLTQQLEFAHARLVTGDTNWHVLESKAAAAIAQVDTLSQKVSSVRQLLLDVLSAETTKPSLELLRKQQLTRTSAQLSLAIIQDRLRQTEVNWYKFHADALNFNFDFGAAGKESRDLVSETNEQIEVWTSASQTTIINPEPTAGLNAIKNIELAHAAARETLALVEDIKASSDDLLLVQDVLTADMINTQHGISGIWTRLGIISGSARELLGTYLGFKLFYIGDTPVTPGGILSMLLILAFGFALSWFIRHLIERLKNRRQFVNSPAVYTLGRILHYIIVLTALFAALGSVGLDFTNFALIAGALSVGIGFGLQSIVNNFVSGLILLFEGSLRVGDYIQLDTGLRGIVKEINTRATVINTNDSVDVVVPNSDFVTNQLTNWTLREPMARFRIDFIVAYGSDKEEVRKAGMEAAAEVNFILHNMPGRDTQVRITAFGDNGIEFQLLAWVSKAGVRRPERIKAEFLWALETKLREHGITIPYPQRDLHLRSGFDRVKTYLPEPEPPEKENT